MRTNFKSKKCDGTFKNFFLFCKELKKYIICKKKNYYAQNYFRLDLQ